VAPVKLGATTIRVAGNLAHIPNMKALRAQLCRAVLLALKRAARAVAGPKAQRRAVPSRRTRMLKKGKRKEQA